MISKNYLLKILIGFILGIVLANYFRIDWILAFTIWSFVLISLLLLVYFGRNKFQFRGVIGLNIILVFFCSGLLGLSSTLTKNIDNHYYKYFLPKDKLIGTVTDFQQGDGEYNKLILNVSHVVNEYREKAVEGSVLCYSKKGIDDISIGNSLVVSTTIIPIKNKNNPGEFDAENYWKTQGITEMTFIRENSVELIESASLLSTFWYDSRAYFKRVLGKFVGKENIGVASALVLGDKSSLSKESRAIFANSGAMHVLAVSGMHVGILLGFLQFVFYRIPFLRRRNLYIYFALIIVWCFAFLTGLSASVFRASIMFSILAIGQLRGYSFFSLNALMFSGLMLLIIDANYLFNIGFQLSFLAMLGIVFFYRKISNLLIIKNRWLNYFWEGTAIGVAAQIGTVPISLFYFHQFPNYFVLTNIGLLILAGAALISAILLFVFHVVPIISELIGKIVDFIFYVLNGFVSWINYLPFSVSTGFDPNWVHVLLLYLTIIGTLYFSAKKNLFCFRISSIALFILCVGLIVEREMNKEVRELIVYNNYNKTITVKEKNIIYCFFDGEKDSQLDNTKFLTEGYRKQRGCEIQYFSTCLDEKVNASDRFTMETDKFGWKMSYDERKFCLINKIKSRIDTSCIKISGAWNKYISPEYVDETTHGSALMIKPK